VQFDAPSDGNDGTDNTYSGTFKITYTGKGVGTGTDSISLKGTALEPATIVITPNEINFGTWSQSGIYNTGGYTENDPQELFTISETSGNEGFTINGVEVTSSYGDLFTVKNPNNDGNDVGPNESVTRAFELDESLLTDGEINTATANVNATPNSNPSINEESNNILVKAKVVKARLFVQEPDEQVGGTGGSTNYDVSADWNLFDFPVDSDPQASLIKNADSPNSLPDDGQPDDVNLEFSAQSGVKIGTITGVPNDGVERTARFKIYESSNKNEKIAEATRDYTPPEDDDQIQ